MTDAVVCVVSALQALSAITVNSAEDIFLRQDSGGRVGSYSREAFLLN